MIIIFLLYIDRLTDILINRANNFIVIFIFFVIILNAHQEKSINRCMCTSSLLLGHLKLGNVPADWRQADVSQVFTKGEKYDGMNDRFVSLTCDCYKTPYWYATSRSTYSTCLLPCFLHIVYAFMLQNALYGSLLQIYAQDKFRFSVNFRPFLIVSRRFFFLLLSDINSSLIHDYQSAGKLL